MKSWTQVNVRIGIGCNRQHMQAYLRTIIAGIQPKERVPMNLIETLQGLQKVNTQLTIIALNARMLNEIDADAYWKVVKEMETVKGKLLQVMYGD